MQEIEFNLLTEPWVRVRLPDNTVQEVSLTDALVHAQEYMDLAGEMPTQDAAMLRLLLAVLFTVFSRVNEVGESEPLEDEEAALERWGALWELKRFPEQPIRDYLEQWKDRFWLFHPERPFWQVPEAKIGSPFKGGKLNGEVFESENKNNMFASYAGVEKNALTYAQAARWLVFLNNYDDAAAKKKAKDRPSMSPGWLGQLGLVYVKGVNAVQNEYDYFTAVDDCQAEDNAGAGHLGTVEYNSATLYRYATVNVMELERHLDAEKAAEVVRSFGEAFIRSMPTGKQNTFANRTLPDAVYVTIREDQPVNLCGAFERAVRKSLEGYAEPSKSALQAYAQQLYQSFAEAPAKSFTVGTGLEALAPAQPLNTMLDALEEAVKENLTGNEVE